MIESGRARACSAGHGGYRRFGPKGTLILRCSQNLGPKVPLVVWECYLNMRAVITALCPGVPLVSTDYYSVVL